MSDSLYIRLLGGFVLRLGNSSIRIDAPRMQALLAYLVLHRDMPIPRQELAFLLWPGSSEAQARANLRNLLHKLRHILTDSDRFLADNGLTVLWQPNGVFFFDVTDFERAVATAEQAKQRGDRAATRRALELAVSLYQGQLLPNCYDDWIQSERERLHQRFLAAAEDLLVALAEEGDYRRAICTGQQLLHQDPLHEVSYQHLMRLHALSGDRTGALRVYRTCATVLERELGVEPSALTYATYARLMHGELISMPVTAPTPPLAARRSNLPLPMTSFIGRKQELADVEHLLAGTRLLTLTGAGGSGKTRLALEVAARVQAFKDGVWWVELAALSDEALLPQAVATALGVREQPDQSLVETLIEALRPKQLLLLLDNCEHLIDGCASLATALLRACPHLQILATSREALGSAGEMTWRVPGLALPERNQVDTEHLAHVEAVRLFVERASTTMPTFKLTDRNASAVMQICQRLDGLPLAIELAAARVKVLAVGQIAARLDDALRLLNAGNRTDLPRHQTLRAALDWSYDLLAEQERILLRRLAVFVGGFTLNAAEVVCSGEQLELDNILDTLAHLIDKSLVAVKHEHSGEARYELLETVRQYSQDKLRQAGEIEATQRQHGLFFLALVEAAEPELWGPHQRTWLERLEIEHDNLRAVLAWGVQNGDVAVWLGVVLWRFWEVRGYFSEGCRWLETLLTQIAAPVDARANLLDGAGRLAWKLGEFATARSSLKESLTIWRALGNLQGVADTLDYLGAVAFSEGNYPEARQLHKESLALRRQLREPRGLARTLNSLGLVVADQGDYAAARLLHEESLALSRALGDPGRISNSLNNLGVMAVYQGDYATARALFEESLAIKRELGDKSSIASIVANLGVIALNQSDYAAAHALNEESLALFRELGDKSGTARSLDNLGVVAWGQGDYSAARALHGESLSIKREQGDRWGIARSLNNLGSVALALGNPTEAYALHAESLAIHHESGDKLSMTSCLAGLARVALAQTQYERAARLAGATAAMLENIGGSLEAFERALFEQDVATVRAALGEAQFESAYAAGQAMSLEEAKAFALSV